MRNPFIILTSVQGRRVRVNILHIITYVSIKYSHCDEFYTCMTNSSPALTETKFKESVGDIDKMIAEYYNYFQR